MEQTAKKMKLWQKITLGVGIGILSLVVILIGVIYSIWHNEIATIASFKQLRTRDDAHLDGSVYYMEVSGDFYLDDFVAEGGAANDSELIDFITGKITKGLIDMNISESEIACSAFTAVTPEGDRLFGRNYDFDKTNTCIVITEANEGRHASFSTVDLQFLGIDMDADVGGLMDKITCLAAPYAPLDGVNDAGVSCGIFMSYQGSETVATDQNTDKPDFTSTTLLRLILDYADDLEEAVEIASTYDLHDSAGTSFHYMIADASGRSAILEWVAGTDQSDNDGSARELVVTYNDADSDIGEIEERSNFQWITNFIIQPDYYGEGEHKPGEDRYDRIFEELAGTGGVVEDEQAAMDILAIVGRRTWNNDDKNGCTVHSVVYNLTDKTILWIPNEHYGEEDAVFTFRLGE